MELYEKPEKEDKQYKKRKMLLSKFFISLIFVIPLVLLQWVFPIWSGKFLFENQIRATRALSCSLQRWLTVLMHLLNVVIIGTDDIINYKIHHNLTVNGIAQLVLTIPMQVRPPGAEQKLPKKALNDLLTINLLVLDWFKFLPRSYQRVETQTT